MLRQSFGQRLERLCEIRDVRLWRDGNQVRTTALYQWNVENTSGDDENWSVEYKHVLTAYNDSTREHTIDDWHATRPNVFTDPVEQNSFTCEDGGFLGHGDISFHNDLRLGVDVGNDERFWVLSVYIDIDPDSSDLDGSLRPPDYEMTLSTNGAG